MNLIIYLTILLFPAIARGQFVMPKTEYQKPIFSVFDPSILTTIFIIAGMVFLFLYITALLNLIDWQKNNKSKKDWRNKYGILLIYDIAFVVMLYINDYIVVENYCPPNMFCTPSSGHMLVRIVELLCLFMYGIFFVILACSINKPRLFRVLSYILSAISVAYIGSFIFDFIQSSKDVF